MVVPRLVCRVLIAWSLPGLAQAVMAGGTVWHVNDNAPSDPGPGDPLVSDPAENGSVGRPFDSIQEAINAAGFGDTVLVEDGAYTGTGNINIRFLGKSLTLRSVNGPATCVIDVENRANQRAMVFEPTDTQSIVVGGFTLRRGNMVGNTAALQQGGAIRCVGSSPRIEDCIFEDNTARFIQQFNNLGAGGGAYFVDSGAQVVRCVFRRNKAAQEGGGATCLRGSVQFDACTFTANSAATGGGLYLLDNSSSVVGCVFDQHGVSFAISAGGGLYVKGGSPQITRCYFLRNVAASGGGLGSESTAAIIHDCLFHRNRASAGGGVSTLRAGGAFQRCTFLENIADERRGEGGGAYCRLDGVTRFDRCTFMRNRAIYGGGFYDDGSTADIRNCIIAENRAGYGGGAYPGGLLTNCTIVRNEAYADFGGTLYTYGLTNCIVWYNEPNEVFTPDDCCPPPPSHCNIRGGYHPAVAEPGIGNIDAEPFFAFTDDYHILGDSPCRDAGTNTPSGGLPESDYDGRARVLPKGGTVDIGAFEYDAAQSVIAISPLSLDVFALEGAPDVQQRSVWIRNAGAGTLHWQFDENCPWLDLAPISGVLNGEAAEVVLTISPQGLGHGVHICLLTVSHAATGIDPRSLPVTLHVNRTLAVPSEFTSIQAAIDASIDGDVIGLDEGAYSGPGFADVELNFRNLAILGAENPLHTTVDLQQTGRAFVLRGGTTRLESLTILNGRVVDEPGGAIETLFGDVRIRNCSLLNNTAFQDEDSSGTRHANGGALHALVASVIVESTTFAGNQARALPFLKQGGSCGAIWAEHSRAIFEDSVFEENSTTGHELFSGSGGALGLGGSRTRLTNCRVARNVSGRGGGISTSGGFVEVDHCEITDNNGGGLYLSHTPAKLSDSLIARNVVAGNANSTATGGGIQVSNSLYPPVDTLIDRCLIEGNIAPRGAGIGLSQASRGFVLRNTFLTGNMAQGYGGAIFQYYGSPSVSGCTFAGNSAGIAGGAFAVHRGFGLPDLAPSLSNSILWGNTAPQGSQIALVALDGSGQSSVHVGYSDVQGGQEGVFVAGNCVGCTVEWGAGNLDVDPDFVDAPAGDYHISPCSDLVDRGDPDSSGGGDYDIDGKPRFQGKALDIGADEVGADEASDCELAGDFDGNGRLDAQDWPGFASCLSGPLPGATSASCSPEHVGVGDLNGDSDVDLEDFAEWSTRFKER